MNHGENEIKPNRDPNAWIDPLLFRNIGWGLWWGIRIAAAFSLIALVVITFAGVPHESSGDPVPIVGLFTLYWIGGVAAGVVVGAFRPWLEKRSTATLVAIVAAVPWLLGIRVLAIGWGDLSWLDFVLLVLGPVYVGTFVTQLIWNYNRRSPKP